LEVHKQQCVTIKNCDKKNVICAAIPKPKVFAPMHHKKRIMKLRIFLQICLLRKSLGRNLLFQLRLTVVFCNAQIDEPIVSEYLCMSIEHEKLAAESGEKSLLKLPGCDSTTSNVRGLLL
jgi:hypothetical protein